MHHPCLRATRLCTTVLFVAVLVSTTGSGAVGQAGPRWDGTASASGLQLTLNTEPAAVPVDTLLDLRVPDAASTWDPVGTGTARASLAYPGRTGESGLKLLCDFGLPCPEGFPPDYPLTAHADSTTTPEASTPTGAGRAHVGEAEVSSSVSPRGTASLLAPLADVAKPGTLTVSTHQRVVDGAVVVTSRSRVVDLDLGDGAVTVDTVEALTEIRSSRDRTTTTARLRIAGVRTQDGEVVVDHDGAVVTGEQAGSETVDDLNARLATAMQDTPVSLRVLPTTTTTDVGSSAHVRGLEVSVRPQVSGPPLGGLPNPYRTYVVEGVVAQSRASLRLAGTPTGGSLSAPTTPPGTPHPDVSGTTSVTSPGTALDAPATSAAPPAASPGDPEVAPPADVATRSPSPETSPSTTLLAGPAVTAASRAYAGLVVVVGLALLAFRLGAHRLTRPRTRP